MEALGSDEIEYNFYKEIARQPKLKKTMIENFMPLWAEDIQPISWTDT